MRIAIGVTFVDEGVKFATLLENVDRLGQQGVVFGALGGLHGVVVLGAVQGGDRVGHGDGGGGAGIGGVGRHG